MELEFTTTVPIKHPRIKDEVTLLHRRRFAVGIDLGQSHDYTAVCVASCISSKPADSWQSEFLPRIPDRYEVMHLERLPLGMPYPQQVDRLEHLLQRQPLARFEPTLFLDFTGVGRPVYDLFVERRALRHAQGVVITSGRDTHSTDAGWSTPKGELVSRLQALLHNGDLKIASSLPDAAVLARELQDFRVRFTEAGNATFNAREGAHDDLVLALALAVFGLCRPEWATECKVEWSR